MRTPTNQHASVEKIKLFKSKYLTQERDIEKLWCTMHNICAGFDIKCKNSSVYVYCNESTNPED